MNVTDLKAYLNRAKELEAAIFTQRELMDRHASYLRSCRPKMASLPPPPEKPTPPQQGQRTGLAGLYGAILTCIFLPLAGIAQIMGGTESGEIGAILLGLQFFLAPIVLVVVAIINIRKIREARDADIQRYARLTKAYQEDTQNYERLRQQAESAHRISIAHHELVIEKASAEHKKHLDLLTAALERHYASNVVFPKYRNFVAITTMYEYLESRRCSTLEGSHGAYNLYETELRLDKISGQLSTIILHLERIQENQFFLYQEIRRANKTTDAILDELQHIHNSTKLTAWFAGVTALSQFARA